MREPRAPPTLRGEREVLGKRIGPYEVLGGLGEGGAGFVLRARAPSGAQVALKLLKKGTAPDALARFERERRLQGELGEAEGFVPLLATGDSPDGPYLVMPLLEQGTLRDRLEGGPLDVEDAVELGHALARSLGLAHARGIVHRDLKPENVLFDARERPLVADLGLAKHWSPDGDGARHSAALSRSGQFRGTAQYMAPEQMRDARSAGPAADVFAVGAILWECLAGHPAFEGASVLEVLERVQSGPADPIRSACPDVPRWLARAIDRALDPDPARRFPDGAALAHALDARGSDRSRWPLALALVLVVVLGASAVAGWAVRSRRDALERQKAADDARRAAALALVQRTTERLDAGETVPDADLEKAIALAPDVARAWTNRGEARFRRRELAAGSADCDRALALDPREARALGVRAFARTQIPDVALGVAEAKRALAIDPDEIHALFVRAALSLREKTAAREAGDRAVKVHPRRALAHCGRAVSLLHVGQKLEGLAEGRRGTDLEPENPLAWRLRASVERDSQELGSSLASLDRSIALDPGNPLTVALRAQVALALGRLPQARADAERALALGPDCATSIATRALVRPASEIQTTLAELGRALSLAPDDANVLAERMQARLSLDDVAGAREDCEHALAARPDDGFLEVIHASILRRLGDVPGELAAARHAVELDPEDPATHVSLGQALAPTDRAAALAELDRAVTLAPRSAVTIAARAYVLAQDGSSAAPLLEVQRALELDPSCTQALAARAIMTDQAPRRTEDVLDEMDRVIGQNPELAVAHAARSLLLQTLGRAQEASRASARAVELDPRDPVIRYLSSARHAGLHELDRALADLDPVLAADPKSPRVHEQRANLLAERGDLVPALAELDRVVELVPQDPRVRVSRAKLRVRARDDLGARDDLDRAVALDRADVPALDARFELAFESRDWPRAVETAALLREAAPDAASTYLTLAALHRGHGGELARALEDLDEGLRRAPGNTALENDRALTLAFLGRAAEAEAVFASLEAFVRGPQVVTLLYTRAIARTARGDLAGALADLDAAVARAPDLAPVAFARAGIRAIRGDLDGALADARNARRSDPENPGGATAEAYVHLRRGELDEAAALADGAVAKRRFQDRSLGLRGLIRAQRGDAAGAIQDLEASLELAYPSGVLGIEVVTTLARLKREPRSP